MPREFCATKLWPSIACLLLIVGGQQYASGAGQSLPAKPGEPTDPKARKTFAEATDWQKRGFIASAVDTYRKANKQDGGHCTECLNRAFRLAEQIGDYKTAESVARDWMPLAKSDADRATVHFNLALALQRQGIQEKKDGCFSESCNELKTALELDPTLTGAHYTMGVSEAYLHQDDEARMEFSKFLDQDTSNAAYHERASRYMQRVELARARLAPPFAITILDGRRISMDGLAGKVVLIDFWATWCGPCREALPHVREIARKFQGQPFIVLSVSLDHDADKWMDFVAKNEMTWLQYRDGGFDGPMAKLFQVNAIPATFSIDADGVLEDQHVGDASIEGKLKKMIAHAAEAPSKPAAAASTRPANGAATQ